MVAALRQFLPAAPAHNAIYLTAIEAFREAMPGIPIVAAFEPEFHATMPEHAQLYGVPALWLEEGVARYGFHGASHQYVGERVAALLGPHTKLVSFAIWAAVRRCVRSRMAGRSIPRWGFSPQSGLENTTRHGDLDVFAVFYMMERHGWSTEEVRRRTLDRRRSGGPVGSGRWRPAGHRGRRSGGQQAGATSDRDVRVPGEKDALGAFAAGDGWIGGRGAHRRDRRELRPIADGVLSRGLGIPGS